VSIRPDHLETIGAAVARLTVTGGVVVMEAVAAATGVADHEDIRVLPHCSVACGWQRNMNERVFKQELKGLERYFFRCPNSNLITVARLKGEVSSEQLRAALSRLKGKYPLLGVKVSLDDSGIVRLMAEGVPENSVRVEQVIAGDPEAWIRKVDEEQRERFEFDKGPLVRFTLLNSGESSDLIINCHHAICDALSLTYLIRDILFSVANPDWKPEPLARPQNESNGGLPSPRIDPFHRIMMKVINMLWRKSHVSFNETDYEALHQKYWGHGKSNRTLSWGLTELETSALVNRCREEHVTVNSAIATAVVAAQRDIQGAGQPGYASTVSMPVSIRGRLTPPAGEAFGLYVSTVKADLTYARGDSFWPNVKRIHRRIKRRLTDGSVFLMMHKVNTLHPSLIDAMYFSKYGLLNSQLASLVLRLAGIRRMNVGWEISNLGRCDLPVDYGPLKLESIIVPAFLSDYQEKCLRIATVGGRMFFSLTFWEDILDTLTARRIIDTSMRYLNEASC
jgi:NRPS condensation-like uncharacterized protein